MDDYFDKNLQSYYAESYEIKIRYVLNNLSKYPQAGRSDIINSPFSDVFSHNNAGLDQCVEVGRQRA